MEAAQRLIVALDVDDMATALALVDLLGDTVSRYKVGYRLFLAAGWQIVEELEGRGKWVFGWDDGGDNADGHEVR